MSKEKRMATAQESFVAFFFAESKGEANDRDRFDGKELSGSIDFILPETWWFKNIRSALYGGGKCFQSKFSKS